jgi:CMP-2-keto-3-deoxyoctulosonic acid synthetase
MAVFYDVPMGETLVIRGPANVTVKGGEVPVVGKLEDITSSIPEITSLEPDSAESGSENVTMVVNGSGFTENSVIVFGQHDEPTTLISETQVSTGVTPSLFAPATVPVKVRNGPAESNEVNFTFTDPAASAGTAKRRRS